MCKDILHNYAILIPKWKPSFPTMDLRDKYSAQPDCPNYSNFQYPNTSDLIYLEY